MALRNRPVVMRSIPYIWLAIPLLGCQANPVVPDDVHADAPSDVSIADAAPTFAAERIGPEGGSLRFEGVTLTVPPGALRSSYVLRLAASSAPAPAASMPRTRRYTFGPPGLSFGVPATVSFEVAGGPGSVYWSTRDERGFEALVTRREGMALRAEVVHFSDGFVGAATTPPADGGSVDAPVDGPAADRPGDLGTSDVADADAADMADVAVPDSVDATGDQPDASMDALDARFDAPGEVATLDAGGADAHTDARTDALDGPGPGSGLGSRCETTPCAPGLVCSYTSIACFFGRWCHQPVGAPCEGSGFCEPGAQCVMGTCQRGFCRSNASSCAAGSDCCSRRCELGQCTDGC